MKKLILFIVSIIVIGMTTSCKKDKHEDNPKPNTDSTLVFNNYTYQPSNVYVPVIILIKKSEITKLDNRQQFNLDVVYNLNNVTINGYTNYIKDTNYISNNYKVYTLNYDTLKINNNNNNDIFYTKEGRQYRLYYEKTILK